MRKTLILILLLSSLSVNAQDVITLRTGEQIQARVTEVSSTELRFRLFNQPTGPIRVLSVSEVFAITYENGTRELFNTAIETRQVQNVIAPTQITNVSAEQTAHQTNRPQQGDWGIGGSFLIAVDAGYTLFGIGARLLYNASNVVRLEGSFAYFFSTQETILGIDVSASIWELNFNTHFLVPLGDNVVFYPLAGFGVLGAVARASGFGQTVRESQNYFCINLGGGLDFRISEVVRFNIEPRYKLFTERGVGGMFFLQAGLAFRF